MKTILYSFFGIFLVIAFGSCAGMPEAIPSADAMSIEPAMRPVPALSDSGETDPPELPAPQIADIPFAKPARVEPVLKTPAILDISTYRSASDSVEYLIESRSLPEPQIAADPSGPRTSSEPAILPVPEQAVAEPVSQMTVEDVSAPMRSEQRVQLPVPPLVSVRNEAPGTDRDQVPDSPAELGEPEPAEMGAPDTNRSISVDLEPGNNASITLDGRGWVFLGSDMEMRFISKTREDEAETFSFYVPEPQDGTARFQRQNLVSGELEERRYILEFALTDEAADAPVTTDQTGTPSISTREIEGGADFPAVPVGASPGVLEEYAAAALDRGDRLVAIEAFERLMEEYPAYRYLDRALFTLASILENPGDGQDVRRSLGLFRTIVDFHPFSAFEPRARERIRYIQSTFIRVF
jgi:hypothetical protein